MISVIIPFYNTGASCKLLVEKLLNDRVEDLQIICINDCSTDDSLKIMNEAFRDEKKVTILHQTENSGASAARNRGLDEAKGDLVVFLDSDDDIAEMFLFEMSEAMNSENACLSVCGIRQNYLHSNKIVDKFTNPPVERHDGENLKDYALRTMVKGAHLYSSVNKIYRGKIIRDANLRFDEKLKFAEDTTFVLEYLAACEKNNEIIFIPDPLYTYNYGTETSVVSESALDWKNWEKNYRFIKNWAGKNNSTTLRKLLRRFKISHALAVARSKKSFCGKLKYENFFILLVARILVKVRG